VADLPPENDPFAAARTNLRDTIKWLIAAFAALAVAVLGSSPLTGFGTLAPGWRLYLAIGAGFVGLSLVFVAIYIAFRLLVWRPFFLSDLAADSDLFSFIEEHSADLLPPELPRFAEFLQARDKARAFLQQTSREPDAPNRAKAKQFITDSDLFANRLLSLAYFEHLRRQLMKFGWVLFALALAAVVALGIFAWAANPTGKGGEKASSTASEQHEHFVSAATIPRAIC
jgi:hypothetical protein